MATLKQGQMGPSPTFSAQNPTSGIRAVPAATDTSAIDSADQRPAKVLRQSWSGDPNDQDPSQEIQGMPPNYGEGLLPHVITFQGIISSVARIYRPSDEAIKDSFDNAKFMRNDPAIMECLEQRQRSTALLDWHLEPEDPDDANQNWLADELTTILKDTPRFMQLRENLLHALWYGRYGVQLTYRWKKIGKDLRVTIASWKPVNGDKIVFRYDDGMHEYDPDQVGIRVGAGFTTGTSVAKYWEVERLNKVEPTDYGLAYFLERWERDLIAIHKHMIEDGEYEDPQNAGRIHGVGIRSRIYWAWYMKQEALAWMMEYLERSAFGIEIWYYPFGNPDAEAKVRTAAEERIGLGRNVIMVPRPVGEDTMAYGVERIEPGMAGVDALKDIIQTYFGHLIKRYILGQTLTTEAESTGLGSNLASVHLDTYLQIVKYDATNLEETITTDILDKLKEFNFPGSAHIPIRFRIDTESPDVEGKLEAWQKAFEMGVKLKESEVMELIGAGRPEEGDAILQNPQFQQAQQQMAMMGEQQDLEQERFQHESNLANQQQGLEQQRLEHDSSVTDQQQGLEQERFAAEKERADKQQEAEIQQKMEEEAPLPPRFDVHGNPLNETSEREKVTDYEGGAEKYAGKWWKESDHERVLAGSAEGGQFGSGEGSEERSKRQETQTTQWFPNRQRPGSNFSSFTAPHPTKGRTNYIIHSQSLDPEFLNKTSLSDWQKQLLSTPQWKKFVDESWDENKTQPVDLDFQKVFDDDAFGITGTGHAKEVIGKVIAATESLVSAKSPPVMIFTAREPSRAKLYRNIVKRVGRRLESHTAFESEVEDIGVMFFVVKNDKVSRFSELSESLGKWDLKVIDVESARGRYVAGTQSEQFARAYYHAATPAEFEQFITTPGRGKIIALIDGQPMRYEKSGGGVSCEGVR